MDDVYLLKFGGNAIKGRKDLERLSKEVASLIADGANVVLVHGGGPEINAELERLGIEPKKVDGIRITDDKTMEITESVLRSINADVVDCLKSAGVDAVGIPGYEVATFTKKPPMESIVDGKKTIVDAMNVGEVLSADVDSVFKYLSQGKTPVIFPVGADACGKHLNVNADSMAAGIAAGISCKEMIQITDVPGIMLDINDKNSLQSSLTLKEVDSLIKEGVIYGGMIPKVEACRRALMAGVNKVRMVDGTDQRSIVSDILLDVKHGTVITK